MLPTSWTIILKLVSRKSGNDNAFSTNFEIGRLRFWRTAVWGKGLFIIFITDRCPCYYYISLHKILLIRLGYMLASTLELADANRNPPHSPSSLYDLARLLAQHDNYDPLKPMNDKCSHILLVSSSLLLSNLGCGGTLSCSYRVVWSTLMTYCVLPMHVLSMPTNQCLESNTMPHCVLPMNVLSMPTYQCTSNNASVVIRKVLKLPSCPFLIVP